MDNFGLKSLEEASLCLISHMLYLSYSQYCTRISGVLAHGGLGLVSGKKVKYLELCWIDLKASRD